MITVHRYLGSPCIYEWEHATDRISKQGVDNPTSYLHRSVNPHRFLVNNRLTEDLI